MKSVLGIIPCRYNSTRLPGKPLKEICGRPMLAHVYDRAVQSKKLSGVLVATDDERIANYCVSAEYNVVMTSPHHLSGSDRLAEVAFNMDADLYVNIQGDMPFVRGEDIDKLISEIREDDEAACAYAPVSLEQASNVNVVKAIVDSDGNAIAFSRYPIPFPMVDPPMTYYRQLGLYAFTDAAVAVFRNGPPGPIERAESVELYRLLEFGCPVRMVEVGEEGCFSVDTQEDLDAAQKRMSQ